jgi:uncharacterized protein DUF2171
MTYANTDAIQSGWSVWTSDGTEFGKVITVEPSAVRVKKNGLLGGEVTVPRSAIEEVETGRIDLNLTKDEVSHLH